MYKNNREMKTYDQLIRGRRCTAMCIDEIPALLEKAKDEIQRINNTLPMRFNHTEAIEKGIIKDNRMKPIFNMFMHRGNMKQYELETVINLLLQLGKNRMNKGGLIHGR